MFRSFSAKNTLLFLAAPRLHQPTHRLNLINESERATELTEIQKQVIKLYMGNTKRIPGSGKRYYHAWAVSVI